MIKQTNISTHIEFYINRKGMIRKNIINFNRSNIEVEPVYIHSKDPTFQPILF